MSLSFYASTTQSATMDLQVIHDALPDELLRIVASYCHKPVFKCDICKENFYHIGCYRFYTPCTNSGSTKRCQPIYVLYLSWDSAFATCDRIYNRVYCDKCVSDNEISTMIDESVQLNFFFGKQQIVIMEDYCSAYHDYKVMVIDMPKEHKPFTKAEEVLDALTKYSHKTFRGFCMYSTRIDPYALRSCQQMKGDEYMAEMFARKYFHFADNHANAFSDVFMNFRMLNGPNHSFSYWVEGDLVEELKIGRTSWSWNQQKILGQLFLSSHFIEWTTLQHLRTIGIPLFPDDDLSDFNLLYDGNLHHMPSNTIYRFNPSFLRPKEGQSLFEFIRDIYDVHPYGPDHVPYRNNRLNFDVMNVTDTTTEDESDDSGASTVVILEIDE